MTRLTLDWDSDVESEIILRPLHRFRRSETETWQRFDLPRYVETDAGASSNSIPLDDICLRLSRHLPEIESVVEFDVTGNQQREYEFHRAFGFSRDFAVVVHSIRGSTEDVGVLERVDIWALPRNGEEDRLPSLLTELADLPLLLDSEFVEGQCLIGDEENVRRIWEALIADLGDYWQGRDGT
ncbi:MAG: hypothetical protein H6682_18705 [Candidatus Eisenbacteria bacterium]|nr:hypothetical protein [Candidatus Eisenbacteria bacterium]